LPGTPDTSREEKKKRKKGRKKGEKEKGATFKYSAYSSIAFSLSPS